MSGRSTSGAVRVGVSGWTYPDWRPKFYPSNLPPQKELSYVSRRMNSAEINATFYRLKKPADFAGWYQQTPPNFVFAVKGSQYITHMKRLKDCKTALANFFASGVLLLEEKLGPVLWQLPERFTYDRSRLESFMELLPKTTGEASALAQEFDKSKLPADAGVHLETNVDRNIR